MAMAGLAAVFWGSMGVAGQYLLQNCHFTPMDLISIRMLLAGSIFVGIEFFLLKKGALKVFETKQNIIDLIIYTLTIIGTQLTFFVCIQYANAPFAAVLTATVPLWIMIFMAILAASTAHCERSFLRTCSCSRSGSSRNRRII